MHSYQELVDRVPNTFQFCSDGYAGYRQVNYHESGRAGEVADLLVSYSQLARRTRGVAKRSDYFVCALLECAPDALPEIPACEFISL